MNSVIYGWGSIEEVAQTLWSSVHSSLLSGDLVFAYRDSSYQVVIVKGSTDYGVGIITPGYTALVPHCPKEYLVGEVLKDLTGMKPEKSVLLSYKNIFN